MTDREFERALEEAEQLLAGIKDRYAQVQRQAELQQQSQQVKQSWERTPVPELADQLEQLHRELQELEVALESALLSDSDLKKLFWQGLRQGLMGEVFWQVVRFGGLGVVVGWLLKSWSG